MKEKNVKTCLLHKFKLETKAAEADHRICITVSDVKLVTIVLKSGSGDPSSL